MTWQEKNLGDLGRIVTGKTPSRARIDYFGNHRPFVSSSDFDYMNYYCMEFSEGLSESGFEKYKNTIIPRDAIMCVCIGTIGKCAIASQDCLTNQQINSIVCNNDNDAKFVYYLICNMRPHLRAIGLTGGSAQPIINKKTFSAIKVKVPDFKTQTNIGETLSAYDDLIENNRRRIVLLEEAARLLYREWFVHFRFPGHEKAKVIDGLPEGWEIKSVKELADLRGGKQHASDSIQEEGQYPVFGGNGIQGYSDSNTHDGFVIAFGRVGVYCGSIHWSYNGAWINNNASALVPRHHPELFLHNMLACDFTNYRKGAAQPFIPNGVLATIPFKVPPKALATKFCECVRDFRLQQVKLERQNRKLAQARDLLLPRLMSGEIVV